VLTPTKRALLKKRVWSSADLGVWMEMSARQARALLARLDAETGGMLLLTRPRGAHGRYTFLRSALAHAKPDVFAVTESHEERIAALEEAVDALRRDLRIAAAAIGQHTRELARVRLHMANAQQAERDATQRTGLRPRLHASTRDEGPSSGSEDLRNCAARRASAKGS